MEQVAYSGPIALGAMPFLSVLCISVALLFAAMFLVYELTVKRQARDIRKELAFAGLSSLSGGFGPVFMLLWFGVYV